MARFSIEDLEFQVASARLEAFTDTDDDEPRDDRFVWGVVIRASQARQGVQAEWEPPKFTCDRLLETRPNEIQNWRQLAGRNGSWGQEHEKALLYTFEHEPVLDATWRLGLAARGRLALVLDAFSIFAHPGGYDGRLPIHIETELEFASIPMASDDEATARRTLARLGMTDTFEYRVENGVSSLIPTDYP